MAIFVLNSILLQLLKTNIVALGVTLYIYSHEALITSVNPWKHTDQEVTYSNAIVNSNNENLKLYLQLYPEKLFLFIYFIQLINRSRRNIQTLSS